MTHDRICYRIEAAREQEHRADERCRQPHNIREEEHHVKHDIVEDDMTCRIAKAIADFFHERQTGGMCFRLRRLCCHHGFYLLMPVQT